MFQSRVRSIAKASSAFAGGAVILSFFTATYYRPIPSTNTSRQLHLESEEKDGRNDNNSSKNTNTNTRQSIHAAKNSVVATSISTAEASAPSRKKASFCSERSPYFSREDTPLLLSIAQHISIGATTLAIRLFMNTYGEYHIEDDEHYQHFITLVLGGDGRNTNSVNNDCSNDTKKKVTKAPLITISNHRSLFDDPGVVSCLLPLWIGIRPKYNRWGICSQEYCFNDALPSFIKGYIGAGQVLPIQRGAGIDQSLFRDFAALVARGEWCHIFPEAGVWQWKSLGGRGRQHLAEEEASNVNHDVWKSKSSKLKYGIGKLIAHAPITPRVVPFAHVGMENLLPQDLVTRKTFLKKDFWRGDPLKVHIRFGAEIVFGDLIDEYEAKHGELWKFSSEASSASASASANATSSHFESSTSEKELYMKITARVEEHLEEVANITVAQI